jgi:hydrogenase maturation protease
MIPDDEPVARSAEKSACCLHTRDAPEGLAVIAIGNDLRRDDGVARVLCRNLPQRVVAQVCIFDLGPFTAALKDCLTNHKAAIVIDSIASGAPPGSVTIVDLSEMLNAASPIRLKCSHGLSLFDELQVAARSVPLPRTITLFGVEAADAGYGMQLSQALSDALPQLNLQLAMLIEDMRKHLDDGHD